MNLIKRLTRLLFGFKFGDIVFLKEDENKEPFVIVKKTGKSKGPVGQFKECETYHCLDEIGRHWYFREDSLELKK